MSWKIIKPQQAVAFASWLSRQNGPLLFGADANTPLIDAPDFAKTRTHWHTGHRRMHGELGDDLLFGPDKKHDLKDAPRRWLALHPDEMNQLRAGKPSGPLAVTHRTGRRRNSPGTDRRFDSVRVSRHWVVRCVRHLYEKGIAAGNDHAPVIVDLYLRLIEGIQYYKAHTNFPYSIWCHTFRATGITTYLQNGGTLEYAQIIANHESQRTTKLYDLTREKLTFEEVERVKI